MSNTGWRQARSLRWRLLAATLAALLIAMLLAGVLLSGLFREHVLRQFDSSLVTQLDQLTARLEFDADGRPQIDETRLSDPRWSRPYSGLYWQLDTIGGASAPSAVLRSRSLWDATLSPPPKPPADGAIRRHTIPGPEGASLMLVERSIRHADSPETRWRLLVAGDLREAASAMGRFNGVLALSLVTLTGLLCAAALAQVAIGLSPLRSLQGALAEVRAGKAARLDGKFPIEIQPLIDDFNSVLERNAEVVARARTQAGNLAHAIKTPLAVMTQAAAQARHRPESVNELATLVQEQVGMAQRQVDWHLARSRAAAAHGMPGARASVAPIVAGLFRVMGRVHAERDLRLTVNDIDPDCAFGGEAQDLQEMLGNVLDNACQWARAQVRVRADTIDDGGTQRLRVTIDDDGPGIDETARKSVMTRGTRLDESLPGSGLGLAIVGELAQLYGGSVSLGTAELGGLRVELTLPGPG